MTDRRAITSRANLGEHIPEALSREGTTVIAIRLPKSEAQAIQRAAKRAGLTVSEHVRRLINQGAES